MFGKYFTDHIGKMEEDLIDYTNRVTYNDGKYETMEFKYAY